MSIEPFDESPFVAYLGLETLGLADGWCELRMAVLPAHLDSAGRVPAGLLAVIIDTAAGRAAQSAVRGREDGRTQVTLEMHVTCLEPRSARTLTARGRRSAMDEDRVVAEATVEDEQGTALARGRATFLLVAPPRPR